MKPVYEIKFVTNEEFENTPILERLGEDLSDSWSFYNPYTGQIRIRDTGFWEANKYLLEHELEHAVEEHATHTGPNGLRHAKGKKFFKEILGPIFTGRNFNTGGQGLPGLGNLYAPSAKTTKKMNSENDDAYRASQRSLQNPFNMDFGSFNQPQSMTGSSQSTFEGQQTSMGSLNQGLNSQTVNPLSDPYAKYGKTSYF